MHVNAYLDVESVAVEQDDTVTVMLELEAPAAPEGDAERPEHTAVVVLDRSGSMAGDRLDHAKRALLDLVARLDDRDRFGLVAFDDQATVVVPAGRVGDLGRARIAGGIGGVQPGGMTDLSSGYLRGLQEARRVCGPTGATLVLLSDGHANAGVTDPVALEGVARTATAQAVTTSTIGIGVGYDENILAALARGGSGNHAFAEHADAAAAAVAGELEGLLSKTVQAASLLIAPSVAVSSVSLLNDLPAQPVEGGVLVELGDFYAGERRRVVVTIAVPAMAALGLAEVAALTLTYVELPALLQHTVTLPVMVNVVPGDLAANRVRAPEVTQEVLFLATQRAKREAEEALRRGDTTSALGSLRDASEAIGAAPPGVLTDQLLEEQAWLADTQALVADRDPAYSAKRLRSDHLRKSRGYKNRGQGGEVGPEPPC
jgi:Ca-activated chloride channel family protein